MVFLKVSLLVIIGFVAVINGQTNCEESLTNYCACRKDPQNAMNVYEKYYQRYHQHISDLRGQARSLFESRITQLLRGKCSRNLCKLFHNYEDVLITRCEHCLLGCEYEPIWRNAYSEKQEDICSWLVIHGPVLCGQVHDEHKCEFEKHFNETYGSIARTCNGERCIQ